MTYKFTGKTLVGKYRVGELFHSSDLYDIYRGKHFFMDNPVFIKILAPNLSTDENIVGCFSAEARKMSRLSHPGIPSVTDFVKDENGTVFMVMEDIEGEYLKSLIQHQGALPIQRAVYIIMQIAEVLAYLHNAGLMHRRLSSEKVLLTEKGNDPDLVKVLDINSFEVENTAHFEEVPSLENLVYLSPEQHAEEKGEADQRSDIYSLGIILYEILTGELPFKANNQADLVIEYSQVLPPLAAFREDIPNGIEAIMLRALAKDPDMRYQSVDAFAGDIKEALKINLGNEPITIPKVEREVANDNSQDNLWKNAFMILAGISLLVLGLAYQKYVIQTNPLQSDGEGLPVQPLTPATGTDEQKLSREWRYSADSVNLDNQAVKPDIRGGDGYDPWINGGIPPAGAPPSDWNENNSTTSSNSRNSLSKGAVTYTDDQGNEIILVPVKKQKIKSKDTESQELSKPVTPSPKLKDADNKEFKIADKIKLTKTAKFGQFDKSKPAAGNLSSQVDKPKTSAKNLLILPISQKRKNPVEKLKKNLPFPEKKPRNGKE